MLLQPIEITLENYTFSQRLCLFKPIKAAQLRLLKLAEWIGTKETLERQVLVKNVLR